MNPADQVFTRATHAAPRPSVGATAQRPSMRPRMPSTRGYMAGAAATAVGLFFVLWWMLRESGIDVPWIPAGLSASVVMLVAAAAREVVMRRAWTRYILDQDKHGHTSQETRRSNISSNRNSSRSHSHHMAGNSVSMHSAAFRAIQKLSAEADTPGALPEAHLEAYHSCREYLASTDETLRLSNIRSESRIAVRAGQERVRALQKHHLVAWAKGASRNLSYEAQLRGRLSDKIETANRALDVIESALKVYPEEGELQESASAVREFVASVKVAHWIELAERAAFKGQYRRAIDRYRDALFYLSRESMKEEVRVEMAERIEREINILRARLSASRMSVKEGPRSSQKN